MKDPRAPRHSRARGGTLHGGRTVAAPSAVLAYSAAAGGGALGALARWGVTAGLPSPSGWPWATLLVNVTGCLLIGLLLGALLPRFPEAIWLRPLLATGVLGGYTTYSAFAVDVVRLVEDRAVGRVVADLAASLALGLGAAAAGYAVAAGF